MAAGVQENLTHDQRLAEAYVVERLARFKSLHMPVKKLVLGVIEYYLDTYFSYDDEAVKVVLAIPEAHAEEEMVQCYEQFLRFLPVRLRAGIQGRYLYQEPSAAEKQLNQERLMTKLTEEGYDMVDDFAVAKDLGLLSDEQTKLLTNLDDFENLSPEDAQKMALTMIEELKAHADEEPYSGILRELGV